MSLIVDPSYDRCLPSNGSIPGGFGSRFKASHLSGSGAKKASSLALSSAIWKFSGEKRSRRMTSISAAIAGSV